MEGNFRSDEEYRAKVFIHVPVSEAYEAGVAICDVQVHESDMI